MHSSMKLQIRLNSQRYWVCWTACEMKPKKNVFKNGASSLQKAKVETQKVRAPSLISDTDCLGLGSLLKFETWLEWPRQLVETSCNPDNLKIIGLEGVKRHLWQLEEAPMNLLQADFSPFFLHTCVSFSTGLWVLETIVPHFCRINPSPLKGELVFITLSVRSRLTNMTTLELFVMGKASSHGFELLPQQRFEVLLTSNCVLGQNSLKLFLRIRVDM